jgi:hypothetical protein
MSIQDQGEPMLPMTKIHIQRRTIEEQTGNPGFPWMGAFILLIALVALATWQQGKTNTEQEKTEQAKAAQQAILDKAFWDAEAVRAKAHADEMKNR